jgi:RND family efflux transporter MFP subunit
VWNGADVKRLAPLLILAGAGLVVAILFLSQSPPSVRPPDVSTPVVNALRVEPQPISFVVEAQGTVVPRTESELVPQVSGAVVWMSPDLVVGGFFEAGEVLVRIERSDYEVALEFARAALARAESEHARARKERERQQRLADQSISSEARIDDAENAFRVAQAGVREARAKLAQAERDLARTELTSAYDGRVRSESVDVGQFVSRGRSIARLYAVDFAEVRLPVPDRELAYLELSLARGNGDLAAGPAVTLHAEFAGREQVWHGRVVRTEGELDPKSRMVHVVARVDDPYGTAEGEGAPLAVGLFVDARIEGRSIERAFVLPRAALHEQHRVLVLDDDDRLHFRDVEVLRTERDRVVIGSGLSAGERVCVSPLRTPVEGMQVRVSDPQPPVARAGT